jgi:Tol biopolymer transport system component
MDNNAKQTAIIVAIITGLFGCIVAIVGWGQPFAEKVADLSFATSVPSPTLKPLLPESNLPTNYNILFTTFNYTDEDVDIYATDETAAKEINLASGAFIDDYPAWSPDGRYIAFQSGRSGNFEVFVMTSNGQSATNITNNEADDLFPSWSADGKKIIFSSFKNGNYDLYTIDLINGYTKQITNTADINEIGPDWSPDGQRIVFSALEFGEKTKNSIIVMNVDGNERKTILSNDTMKLTTTAWSPNGLFIAFTMFNPNDSGASDIYIIKNDGSKLLQLTNNRLVDADPDWSPDGQKIIFWTSNETGYSDLYLINIDGSGLLNLTNTADRNERGPNWLRP